MGRVRKFNIILIVSCISLFLCACSIVPTYYSQKDMESFADIIFDSPEYISTTKTDDSTVYLFKDSDGRPFSLYTYKYNSGFFKPEDISFIYEKAFKDSYQIDIFNYEKDNVIDIIESYGMDYKIVRNESENDYNSYCHLYIIVPNTDPENKEKIVETETNLASMLESIDQTLNFDMNANGLETPADYNYSSCSFWCEITLEPDETYLNDHPEYDCSQNDDYFIANFTFSTNVNSRFTKDDIYNILEPAFDHIYGSLYN